MLPPGGLSEAPQRGNFLAPDDDAPLFNYPEDLTPEQTPTDWELAGRALNDPSAGVQVQNWTFYVDGPNIMVKPDDGPATVVYSPGAGVLELSGSFDSNMNPCIVWTGADLVTWLRWWNPQTVSYALSTLPALRSPRLTLDDKRASQESNRDILLFYIRNEAVCYRQQRDRYQVEYTLYPLPQGYTRIGRVGMTDRNRMQVELVLACANGTAGVPVDATGCNNPDWCTAPPPNAPAAPPGAVSGTWPSVPCVPGDWDQEIFHPCPIVPPPNPCPLPDPASWVQLEYLCSGPVTLIPPTNPIGGALLEQLEDGSFRSSGSSPDVGDVYYVGPCSRIARAPGTTLQFRCNKIQVVSGTEFTFQGRFIWRKGNGTEVLNKVFYLGDTFASIVDQAWDPTDNMTLEIGHYQGTAVLVWDFQVWSGGFEAA